MAETGRETERSELCPICQEGVLKHTGNDCKPCNFCGAFLDLASGKILPPVPQDNKDIQITQTVKKRTLRHNNSRDSSSDRNLAFAISEIARISASSSLPRTTMESAVAIYEKSIENGFSKGRSVECLAAATIYAACRICDTPRTLNEISKSGNVRIKELGKTYRALSKELNLKIFPVKIQEYVKRYCTILNVSERVQIKAEEIVDTVSTSNSISGLGPSGLAAGAVYLSAILCGEHHSQNEVAEAAEISKVTLRARYKRIAEELHLSISFG